MMPRLSTVKTFLLLLLVATSISILIFLHLFGIRIVNQRGVKRSPPHIVFILADDLGWSDVSWNNPQVIMPNLEKLARGGTILNYSYVAPRCTPTRASLLTGYYPFRIGLQYGVIYFGDMSLPLHFTLLPERLKTLGYATHIVGKWHLGHCSWNYTPTFRGFDTFLGFYGGSEDYYNHTLLRWYDFNNNTKVYKDEDNTYSTFLFRDRSIEIIKYHDADTPLFLYLPFQAAHYPFQVPERYSQMYPNLKSERRTFLGMVTAMDEAVGDVFDALEQRGFLENLLIVFMSDNGGRPTRGGHNWPLRGCKNTLWEGGTRSAGFVYSKTLLPKNYISNHLMNVVDWFPTLLEVAGDKNVPDDIDGVSQWQTLKYGAESPRQEHVYNIEGRAAIRVGQYKLIHGDPSGPVRLNETADDRLGEKHRREDSGWVAPEEIGRNKSKIADPINKLYSLFDLHKDPLEQHDLSEEFPDIVKDLVKRLEYHIQRSVPPVPKTPLNNKFYKMNVSIPGWCG